MEFMLDSEIDDNSSLKKYLNEDNCEMSFFCKRIRDERV